MTFHSAPRTLPRACGGHHTPVLVTVRAPGVNVLKTTIKVISPSCRREATPGRGSLGSESHNFGQRKVQTQAAGPQDWRLSRTSWIPRGGRVSISNGSGDQDSGEPILEPCLKDLRLISFSSCGPCHPPPKHTATLAHFYY